MGDTCSREMRLAVNLRRGSPGSERVALRALFVGDGFPLRGE